MEKEKVIEVKNVIFSYDDENIVLNDVSFDIYKNEYVCIIGHNGSGKSTISKVLVGLLKPQSGYLGINNEIISYLNLHNLRSNVGIIFQNPDSQFVGLTAKDDIAFGLENRKVDPNYMDEIINNAASIVDVKELLNNDSTSLSGGQKQRIAIASVLATNPKIIIFDESTSMLDPKGKKELKEMILHLKNNLNKTVISITHDMDEVLNADRVIVFKQGKILKIGKPDEIFIDEEFLNQSALDFPFILKLAKSLKDSGLKIDLTIDKKNLCEQIRKLK